MLDRAFAQFDDDHLSAVQSMDPPRSEDVASLVVRYLVPSGGFILYGILYLLTIAPLLPISVVGLVLDNDVTLATSTWLAIVTVAFLIGWGPFVVWVKSRRARGWLVARNGTLQEGRILHVSHYSLSGLRLARHVPRGRSSLTRIVFRFGPLGNRRTATASFDGKPKGLEGGVSVMVLAHPEVADLCGVFCGGNLVAARVRGTLPPRSRVIRYCVAAHLLLGGPLVTWMSLQRDVVVCERGDCEYRSEVFGWVVQRVDVPTRFIAQTTRSRKMIGRNNEFVPHYGLEFTLPDDSKIIGRPWYLDPEEPKLMNLLDETRRPEPDFAFRSPFGAWQVSWALLGMCGFFIGAHLLVRTARQ